MTPALSPLSPLNPLNNDPVFPRRDALLDPHQVGAYLSARLQWRQVTRAERVRTTYRTGDSLRVLHRFEADGRVHAVSARAFRDGRSARALDKALASGEVLDAGVVHGEPFEAVFWLFPSDRRLPALKRIEQARQALSARLPRQWAGSRLVTWAPENRATFACLDPSGEVFAYAKVGPGSTTERQLYAALHEALAATGIPLRVPRALAFSEDHDTIVLDRVAGRRLAFTPGDMRGMGRALAHLHGLPLHGLPAYDRCTAASCRAAADLVIGAVPQVAGLIETLARELDRRGCPAAASGCLHGDVHPKNALADDSAVGLIDVEEMAWGARAADLGSLLARLCSARALELETAERVHRAAMALLDGYASIAPLPGMPELRWYLAAAMLVERAQRAVTRLNALALAHLDRLVAEGLRLLDAEGVGL